ncbi:unnamed protein product [Absidia cylindrospora]
MSALRPLYSLSSHTLRKATIRQTPLVLNQVRTQATAVNDNTGKPSKLTALKEDWQLKMRRLVWMTL